VAIFSRNRGSEFDGEVLSRRLRNFLSRTNAALLDVAEALPDFDVDGIEVSLSVDAGLNVGFAGVGGSLSRDRTFTFTLKPKKQALAAVNGDR
jgi:hypothetical protein